jgi:anti-sigma regulatory factor (Ser/Thr protein kinase)/putative methionine-R-sulfoxide reductase with GAF domain
VSTSSASRRKAAVDRLRDIETVTHAGLAHLGVEELLVELLDRVRNVLNADTAAVLLLDGPNEQLVATAARGIEEEVYQGSRVPLGRGFAGRIAANRRPATIEDIADADVVNPVLRENGVRSLLGVPLLAGGELLGVLHVGSIALRRFTDKDAELLQLVGDRIALAVVAAQTDAERKASTLLQRSLLPQRLPQVPGLDVAVRYIAGGGGTVGGDWYDLFTLPSGRVCIAVGDVVGRGVRAAAVMGRLRSALRAHALGSQGDPGLVIELVDRQLRHFDPGEMATAVVAVVEPSFDRIHLSSAGHPAPLLAAGDGEARYLDVAPDPPLGVAGRTRRRTTTVDLPPGAVVCFFTDGLIERRGRRLEDRLELLRQVVRVATAEEVCTTVMGRLIGLEPPGDDVALLAVRRADSRAEPLEVTVPAVPSALSEIRAAVRRWLADVGASAADVTDVLLAVGESTTNVVEHAYGPAGGAVSVRLELDGPDVVVTVRDTGHWRSPRGTNRGRGTLIMESTGDLVAIDRGAQGTEVVIRRRLATVGRSA